MTDTRHLTLDKIKMDLRICHFALDSDIDEQIDACLADLKVCGIVEPDENDALILAAIKLWCRANYTDDTVKASDYLKRYDAQKACLMMAEGYGGGAGD